LPDAGPLIWVAIIAPPACRAPVARGVGPNLKAEINARSTQIGIKSVGNAVSADARKKDWIVGFAVAQSYVFLTDDSVSKFDEKDTHFLQLMMQYQAEAA
jgi:hypothetical protein